MTALLSAATHGAQGKRSNRPTRNWFVPALAILLPGLLFATAAVPVWETDDAQSWARAGQDVGLLREHALRGLEVQAGLLNGLVSRTRGLDWQAAGSDPVLRDLLEAHDQGVSYSAGLALVSPGGAVALSSGPPGSAPEWVQRIVPRVAGELPASVQALRPASALSSPRFVLARPTLAADGRPDGGTAYGALDPAFFDAPHAALVSDRRDVVALVLAEDGTVLTRWPRPSGAQSRLRPNGPLMETIGTMLGQGEGRRVQVAHALSLDGIVRHYVLEQVGTYPVVALYGRFDDTAWTDRGLRLLPLAALALLAAAGIVGLGPLALRPGCHRKRAARRGADPVAEHAGLAAPPGRGAAGTDLRMLGRLQQAERVAVLGQLSTGLAHDFGNLIQSVRSGARLIERSAEDPEKVRRYTAMVVEAAERGQALTRRLVEFARREEPSAEAFDVADSLRAVLELLSHALGERWPTRTLLGNALPLVVADRSELETVLLNLIVNARDALPGGGTITIEASLADPAAGPSAGNTPDTIGSVPTLPGRYLRMVVRDGGIGMDAATLARVGENFFTTKAGGHGAGLGVAMARDFAGRIGGALQIASRPGEGTTVSLWLPLQPDVPAR